MTRLLAAAALGAAVLLPAAPASACINGLCPPFQPFLACATFEWGERICV